jgi:hypothetical protein
MVYLLKFDAADGGCSPGKRTNGVAVPSGIRRE